MADGGDQGAGRRARLRALRARRREPAPSAHVATPFESRTTGAAPAAEHVVAPRHDLRRRDAAAAASTARRSPAMPVDRRASRSPTATCTSAATRSGRSGSRACIDELRVYDRALSGAEVRVDMTRPVTCVSDPQAPVLAVSPGSLAVQRRAGRRRARGQDARRSPTAAPARSTWTASDDVAWLTVSPGERHRRGHASRSRRRHRRPEPRHLHRATSRSAPPARRRRRGRPGDAHRHAPPPGPALRHPRHAGLQRHAGRLRARRPRRSTSPTPAAGPCPGRSPTTLPWLAVSPGERDRTRGRSPSRRRSAG